MIEEDSDFYLLAKEHRGSLRATQRKVNRLIFLCVVCGYTVFDVLIRFILLRLPIIQRNETT